jgi:hypothetical protein
MGRLFLVDHQGRPITDNPTPSAEAETPDQTTLAREFDKFTADEARKASTKREH